MPEIALPTKGTQDEILSDVKNIKLNTELLTPISYQTSYPAQAVEQVAYEINGKGVIDAIYGVSASAVGMTLTIIIDGVTVFKCKTSTNVSGLIPPTLLTPFNTGTFITTPNLATTSPIAQQRSLPHTPANNEEGLVLLSNGIPFESRVEVRVKADSAGPFFRFAILGGLK